MSRHLDCFIFSERLFDSVTRYSFNKRWTYESLIDTSNMVAFDGPRVHMVCDELSLITGRCAKNGLSFDGLILFLDEGSELAKGAACKQRTLIDCHTTGCFGIRVGMLGEILGPNPDRNVLGRFTPMSTQEYRALDEVDEAFLQADMRPMAQNMCDSFEGLLRYGWLDRQARPPARAGLTNARVLLHAHNAVFATARDHGNNCDPFVTWCRKADEHIHRVYVGVFAEFMSDL